jgi:hypothetical protein
MAGTSPAIYAFLHMGKIKGVDATRTRLFAEFGHVKK